MLFMQPILYPTYTQVVQAQNPYAYTLPPVGEAHSTIAVGTAIEDLAEGGNTQGLQAHTRATEIANKTFSSHMAQYEIDFAEATAKATEASTKIGKAYSQRFKAITLLVISIVAAVGIGIAAAITGTLPLGFIAIPFLIGIAPASYYTHIFNANVDKLERTIEYPKSMKKPVLQLPIYNPNHDLGLQASRLQIQESFAAVPLSDVASSEWTDKIVPYALLDRTVLMNINSRPAFYAKCIQLIDGHKKIVKERDQFKAEAKAEKTRLWDQLWVWRRREADRIAQERAIIDDRKSQLFEEEKARTKARRENDIRNGNPHPYQGSWTSIFMVYPETEHASRRVDLMENEMLTEYERRDAENDRLYQSALAAIDTSFKQALANLEQQYANAKSAAKFVAAAA